MVESLDAGNSVIHQPADWSPSSAALLADCAHQAGFPAGACNLVQGIGEEVGAALVADPGVRPITFIGSPPTAGHIGRAAAEAVELANSTAYELSAIVFTTSAERAERVGRALRTGLVWVNTFLVRDLTAPFGGIGISGIGREGGDHALECHSDLKTLMILNDSVS